ncbi:MAG: transpeptidase family protein [Deltaproteobacteria bacterium]|nr:transpeptidase family protein [Deltaproteobacteria bacterium]
MSRWGRLGAHVQLRDRAGQSPEARYARGVRRMRLIGLLLTVYLIGAVAASLGHVVHVDEVKDFAIANTTWRMKIDTRRGDIVDRNGVTLATDVRSDALVADPKWFLRKGARALSASEQQAWRERVATEVAKRTGVSRKVLLGKLAPTRGFVYLAKDLDIEQSRQFSAAIEAGQLPGLSVQPAFRRHHPGSRLAGALLGKQGWQGNVESSLDGVLRGQKVEIRAYKSAGSERLYLDGAPDPSFYGGRTVELTIDKQIQAVAEDQLALAIRDAHANHGVAVVLDIDSAEILALAQSPSYDPDDRVAKAPPGGFRNRCIQDQFEPGSTLKVLTYAAALEEGKVRPDEVFATAGGLRVPGKLITDSHPHGDMTAAEVIKFSSNVGIGKMAMRLGRITLGRYLDRFGIGRRTDVGLADEINGSLPSPATWKPVRMANIAFGQGVAVTALQLTNAFAAIGRGGVYKRPRLLRAHIDTEGNRRDFEAEPGVRVVSDKTARLVLDAMALVCEKGGTARRGRLDDYRCSGKTGTAQQYDPKGGYSKTHWIASFIGLYPKEKPRLAIYVAVDTPRKHHPKYPNLIIRTGGEIAAPVVREIARFSLPYLGVPKSPGAPWLAADDPAAARERAERRAAKSQRDTDEGAADEPHAAAVVLAVQPQARPGRTLIPDLAGQSMPAALAALQSEGLQLRASGSGVAVRQQPAPGVLARAGDVVEVHFERRSAQAGEATP